MRLKALAAIIIATALLAPRLCGAEENGAGKTLSLRASDGLVVADCGAEMVEALSAKIEADANPPSTIRGVFRWLLGNGVSAGSIRVYLEKSGAPASGGGAVAAKWTTTDLRSAERGGMIPSVSGLELYEAYMLLRSAGYAVYFDSGAIKKEDNGVSLDHTVFVLSSAALNGYHGIYVDGKDYSKGAYGYNVAAFDASGAMIAGTEGFSLFSDSSAGQKMAGFINSFPDGTIILASIHHGPGVYLTGDATRALHNCGSAEYPDPEVLSSHAMIGKKGLASGSAIENSAVNAGANVIYFSDKLYVDGANHKTLSLETTGRAVILTGLRPDDRIYIYSEK